MPDKKKSEQAGEELVKREVITREQLEEARKRERASGLPWYRQLLQRQIVPIQIIDDILRYEFHLPSDRAEHQTLGQALVDMGAITAADLKQALTEQKRSGRLLGNVLRETGLVTPEAISVALSKQYQLEYAELENTPSDPEALQAISESVARSHKIIPISIEGDRLTVLVANPQSAARMGDLGVRLGLRIRAILTSCEDVRKEIVARYRGSRSKTRSSASGRAKPPATTKKKETATKETKGKKAGKAKRKEEEVAKTETTEREIVNFEQIAREAQGLPVIKLVSTILEGAANSGATDIHLDPQEPEMRVRYRIDGVLHDVMSIPPEIETAVVSRVKILCDMDITETRHPQDGHISLDVGDDEYDVRVATLPTYLGERVVLRLLDQSTVLAGIRDLGIEPDDEKKLIRMIEQPYGMILVTGPTGSGKTTTLYASLNQKDIMSESIVTLEDPVEYQMSGINQVQIETDIDLTFALTLRAALRQDIDVLLVGEIRDVETARIAIRAAMTGHLVFSTLHTNDAPEAITTLRNMGIPSYLIASALTAIVAQRLVRTVCPKCKKSFMPSKALLKSIRLPANTGKLYRGEGCAACYHTGNKGRTGIFEVLEMTPDIRKLISEDVPTNKIVTAAKLKTMADRCREKVKKGIVEPEEFLRVIRT